MDRPNENARPSDADHAQTPPEKAETPTGRPETAEAEAPTTEAEAPIDQPETAEAEAPTGQPEEADTAPNGQQAKADDEAGMGELLSEAIAAPRELATPKKGARVTGKIVPNNRDDQETRRRRLIHHTTRIDRKQNHVLVTINITSKVHRACGLQTVGVRVNRTYWNR